MNIEKNCFSCKKYIFCKSPIKQNIDDNSEMQIFSCPDYESMYMSFPVTVSGININTEVDGLRKSKVGSLVAIRPCNDENDKTYLGMFLGELPAGINVSHNNDTKQLNVGYDLNPAIYVFDLKKIVFGYESWWSFIDSEKQFKQITDEDIDSQWYVQFFKSFGNE